MSTKEDLKKYPVFQYDINTKKLNEITNELREYYIPFGYTAHHYVKQQVFKRNPEKYKHLQKIIFLPTYLEGFNNMHAECDSRHSNFESNWKIKLNEVLYIGE